MNTERLIKDIVDRLQHVAGVEAIVLGGSRARGTHTSTSDIDLGIYYLEATALDLATLTHIATELDDDHRPQLMTAIGGWGSWINGGGWLNVQTIPVDLLYRDLSKVTNVIHDCHQGRIEVVYQPGHPHAFLSSMYLAELALCQPLWDPHGAVAMLKEYTQPYPASLQQAIIDRFFWEADFSLRIAQKSASRRDVAYAAGCCFRCVACLTHTLFALNEQYWMNEKGAVALAATFSQCPNRFDERVAAAFRQLDAQPAAIVGAIDLLNELVQEVRILVVT